MTAPTTCIVVQATFQKETLAVKTLFNSQNMQVLDEFLNEVVLITGIKHRNLVQLRGCSIDKGNQRLLVYEYVENGNVAEALWGNDIFISFPQIMNLQFFASLAIFIVVPKAIIAGRNRYL
jgi:hypothetical protein